jgi:hypothetical protein
MAVTDVKKLRPELLSKSKAELERQAAEIAMAIAELEHQEEIKAKEALAAEAGERVERIVADVKWLHDNGLLPERVATGFSRNDGTFAPGMILRAPTAESLAGTRAAQAGEKKRRRRRDPVTGEWVESKAAQRAKK